MNLSLALTTISSFVPPRGDSKNSVPAPPPSASLGCLQGAETAAPTTLTWLTFLIMNTYKVLFERKVTLKKRMKTWVAREREVIEIQSTKSRLQETPQEQKTKDTQNNEILKQINFKDARE